MKFLGNLFSGKDKDNEEDPKLMKEEKKKLKKDDETSKKDDEKSKKGGDKSKKKDKNDSLSYSKRISQEYESIRIEDIPPTDPVISAKKPETFVFTPIVTKKSLTIILIEDTKEVAKESKKILRFCKSHILTDWVCIIRYGENFTKTDFDRKIAFKDDCFECTEKAGEKACLSDVLVEIGKIVSEVYDKEIESNSRKAIINHIDIIGFGTCKDNCSKNSRDEALKAFAPVTQKSKIVTKYFSLTDKSFIDAAEIGFHSITSISKNYN